MANRIDVPADHIGWGAVAIDDVPQSAHAGTGQSTAGAAKPVGTTAQLADFLINGFWGGSGHHWGSTTVTYSLGNLNGTEQALALSALNAWHEVSGLNFVQVSSGANIAFNHNGNMVASTSTGWNGAGLMLSATITISSNWIAAYGSGIYSYGYQTYLHEIGHAIGLGHQGSYNGSGSYGSDAFYANDTWQYSVMSYFTQDNYNGGTDDYVITPMMADIYAAQLLYGSATTRTGNTTYGFNSNAGSIYNFALYAGTPALTIYDSGGTDTLDASGYAQNQTIDLTPGGFSSIGGFVHNIGIYTTTTIENGTGGSGGDAIIGNTANNLLVGNGGNDTLYGGNGNDQLQGGTGNDTLWGGLGADTFIFAGPGDGIDIVQDFVSGQDVLALSRSGFGLASTGSLATAGVSLVYGSAPTSGGPTIMIQGDRFYWDGDGTGPSAAVQLSRTVGVTSLAYSLAPNVEAAGLGDFNGNGNDDIFLFNTSTRALTTWLMDRGSVVGTISYSPLQAGWTVEMVGDFNGDGTDDILFHHAPSGNTGAWLMSNGRPVGWAGLGSVGSQWAFEGVGDLNADGTDDVLFRDTTSGYTGAWLMRGGVPVGWVTFGIVASQWNVEGIGDLNGDGFDDVMFRDTTSGYTGAWLMGSSGPSNWAAFGNVASTWTFAGIDRVNGDAVDDVIFHNTSTGQNGAWTISNARVTGWMALGATSAALNVVGVADLDNNGVSDVFVFDDPNNLLQATNGLTANDFLIV